MAEKGSAGQADKAAAESKTAQVGASQPPQQTPQAQQGQAQGADTAPQGADANNPEGSVPADAQASQNTDSQNPYPNYDFMTLDKLQELADSRGVEVNRDVLKAHLITELRAADSGSVSPATRRGAR